MTSNNPCLSAPTLNGAPENGVGSLWQSLGLPRSIMNKSDYTKDDGAICIFQRMQNNCCHREPFSWNSGSQSSSAPSNYFKIGEYIDIRGSIDIDVFAAALR